MGTKQRIVEYMKFYHPDLYVGYRTLRNALRRGPRFLQARGH